MSASSVADRTLAQEFVAFLIHIPLALCGGTLSYIIGQLVLRFVSVVANLNIHSLPSFFSDVYDPLFWLGNVLFAVFVTRSVRSRSGSWVAIVGLLLLATILLWDYSTMRHLPYFVDIPGGFWNYEWKQMFTSECTASECLGHLFTLPSFALMSYGLGACIGLTFIKTGTKHPGLKPAHL